MSDKIRYVKPGEIDIFHRWYDNRKDGDACYEGLDEILDKTIGIPVGLENMLSISLETKHTKNGTMYEYLEFYAGADYEYPMYFIIYMSEDNELIAYTPKYGSGGDGIHGCAWGEFYERGDYSDKEVEYFYNCNENPDLDTIEELHDDSQNSYLFDKWIEHTLTVRGDEVKEMPPIPDKYMEIHNKLMSASCPWWDKYQKDLHQKI